MKLVTFKQDHKECLGAVAEGENVIVNLSLAHQQRYGTLSPVYQSMQHLIDSGKPALHEAEKLLAAMPETALINREDADILSPLPVPVQLRDFLCFETHMAQAGASVAKLTAIANNDTAQIEALKDVQRMPIHPVWYKQPIYYKCNRFAVAGTGTDIQWPSYSKVMDYELELAMVIGRKGKDIKKENARDYIFGYTIFNDFSARDAQAKEMAGPLGPAKGKDFDGANILGPCIVTADEIENPYDLSMTAKVNGELWTQESSSSIHWTFEEMIAFVSQGETLYPGEVFGSGTVGNGCGLEQMKFLNDGDLVELEITSIGRICNTIVAPHTR